jgi:hypothetical protein
VPSREAVWLGAALLLGTNAMRVDAATPAPAPTAVATPPLATTAPSAAEIDAAVTALRADPALGGEHKTKRLRWVHADESAPQAPAPWLVALFESVGRGMSLVLWVAGAIGVAVLVVWVLRLLGARSRSRSPAPLAAAVMSSRFDLRAEGLPDDVGAAARGLLEAGRPREALSLLYRGALSRAEHRFGVRIEVADTESDVLRAVHAGLDPERAQFVARVIRLWQLVGYAGAAVPADQLLRVCAEFAATLGVAVAESRSPGVGTP